MRPFHRKLRREPMRVLLRHADAGQRGERRGPDHWRSLSPLGQAQAGELVARIGGLPITRVLSGPALRCRQTVLPLARELSLEVEPSRVLAENADPAELMRFLQRADTENAVLCTHRETLLGVFAELAVAGSRLIEGITRMEMAASWALYSAVDTPPRLRLIRSLADYGELSSSRDRYRWTPAG